MFFVVMVLLPQAKGTIVALGHQVRLLGQQFHQSSPAAEIHPELIEQVAIHKMVFVGH